MDIFNTYDSKDSRFLYVDKYFDNRGIDYSSFIKLRYESINEKHIVDTYTLDGWYILWYLLGNSNNGAYIKTTVNDIVEEIKYKAPDVIYLLKLLEKLDVIKIKNKNFTNNTLLKIAIGYNEDNIINNKTKGYISIPKDFIRVVLPSLNKIQWAIFTVLCVRYNYIYPTYKINEETGKPLYYTTENCYAYPTQEQIGELLDIKDVRTVRSNIKKLEESKFKLIRTNKVELSEGGFETYVDQDKNKNKIRRFNNTYYIYLLERMEYTYHCIYNIPDDRKNNNNYNNFFKELKKKGLDDIMSSELNTYLTKKDYIEYRFSTIMEDYKKCLTENDNESYNQIKQEKILPKEY